MRTHIPKKRVIQDKEAPGEEKLEEQVRRQMAWSTASTQFKNRDPMFHITDNFMRTFDLMGGVQDEKSHLQGMKEEVPGLLSESEKKNQKKENEQKNSVSGEQGNAAAGSGDGGMIPDRSPLFWQSRMRDDFDESPYPDQNTFLNKFSEIGFMRGKMSAGVVKGTGDMMLFSCLKRTLGQSQPKNIRQRKLFMTSSRSWKPRSGAASDAADSKFTRNETYSDSAVALTVKVTKDARRTVEQLSELIKNEPSGAETLEKMAPFLNTEKDELLIDSYKQKLSNSGNGPEDRKQKNILEKALTREESILAKKTELKNEFTFKLRALAGQAREASALFSSEEFQTKLKELLSDSEQERYRQPDEGTAPPDDELPPGDSFGFDDADGIDNNADSPDTADIAETVSGIAGDGTEAVDGIADGTGFVSDTIEAGEVSAASDAGDNVQSAYNTMTDGNTGQDGIV